MPESIADVIATVKSAFRASCRGWALYPLSIAVATLARIFAADLLQNNGRGRTSEKTIID